MNFDLIETRWRELLAQRAAGTLNAAQFDQAATTLRLQDEAQRWWQIDPTRGQWQRWDGARWLDELPPRPASPGSPQASPPMAGMPQGTQAPGAQPQGAQRQPPAALAQPMEQAAGMAQGLWQRFTKRMISPAEFMRQSQLPMAQRSQGWWDVLAVGGGALSGYIWFLYSSIRGMPHFKLLGMSGARNAWYDFLPSLMLAALPFILFAFRGPLMGKAQVIWTRISASISYAMMLGAGLIVGAIVLNWLSPALFGWAFAFREGLDFTTPLLMVGIPVALALFRPETDKVLGPIQPARQAMPKFVLVGIALAVPYVLAFLLYRLAFNQYELLHWNLALGILIPYALLRNPPLATAPAGASIARTLAWMLPAGLLLGLLFMPEVRADDCTRDVFNLRDCLRTGGYAEVMSGTASTIASVLTNGADIIRIFLPPGSGPQTVPPEQEPQGPAVDTPTPGSEGQAPATQPEPEQKPLDDPRAELDRVNQQWEQAKQGVDPNDPGYNDFKKQYDDYRDWLKQQIADQDAAKAAEEAARLAAEQAAREQAEREAEWLKQREEDLKQTREQAAFVAAAAAGAKQAGFDTSDHERQLKDLKEREGQLVGQVGKAGGDTSYQATQRDVIPVGEGFKEAIRLQQEQKRQEALKAAREKLEKAQQEQAQTEKDYWKTVKEEFWGGVTQDVDAIPGQLKDAAYNGAKYVGDTIRDTGKALTDAENWKAMGQAVVQTGKDLVGSPLHSAKKVGDFYGNVASTAGKVVSHVVTHPIETGKAIIGYDNWEKAMDPNVPVTERIGRTLVGIADAALNLTGAGLVGDAAKAAAVADKAGDVIRTADKVGDMVRTADKAGDMVRTADKAGDVVRTADKAGDTVRNADKAIEGTRGAEKAKAAGSEAKAAAGEAKAAAGEGKAAGAATKGDPVVPKPVSQSEAAANKAARAEERLKQTGQNIDPKTGKPRYEIKEDPKVNMKGSDGKFAGSKDGPMAGVTTPAQKHAQVVADKHGVKIDVRPTTKYAHDPIANGTAVPKAPHCKTKTINDNDVLLGAKPDNKGLAGYFDPKKPVQGDMSDKDFKKLMDRYNERKQEFKDQFEHLTELKKEGKCHVKDGVVIDGKTGKPYSGDHDVFDIRDAHTGQPLPRYQVDPKGNVMYNADGTPKLNPVREQIMKELQQPPFSAQHGAHMDWKYDHLSNKIPEGAPPGAQSDFGISQGVDKGVIGKHTQEGGEALITYGPDQPPAGSWFKGER